MATRDTLTSTVARDVRPRVGRLAIAIGSGFLVLAVLPVVAAVVLGLSGGDGAAVLGLVSLGVLGFLLVLAALPLALAGVAVLACFAAVSAAESSVTDQRLRLLHRVEALEETTWWGHLLRPSERLAFLDPRTADERFEAALDDAKSAYVAGHISEPALERRLDRLFGLETAEGARAGSGTLPSRSQLEHVEEGRGRELPELRDR